MRSQPLSGAEAVVLQCGRMATDIERLSPLMLDEFGRVHDRLDQHDERFDRIDDELGSIRAEQNRPFRPQ